MTHHDVCAKSALLVRHSTGIFFGFSILNEHMLQDASPTFRMSQRFNKLGVAELLGVLGRGFPSRSRQCLCVAVH